MAMQDLVTLQKELEHRYNRYQQKPLLRQLFKDHLQLENEYAPHVYKILIELAIQKRIHISSALGILATDMPLIEASALIEFLVGLECIYHEGDELVVVLEPDEETKKMMEHYMFPPPMVCKPEPVTNNNESGYLLAKKSVMSKKSHTFDDVCLDVINILNSFEFTLDLEVLNYSSEYKSLASQKPDETRQEYEKRYKQWQKFDTTTRELIEKHYKDIETIWFTHQYDKRGRFNCRGYHFNYQGSEWHKALIQMKPELL